MKPHSLIIGLGNPLRGDDALGPIAASAIRRQLAEEPSNDLIRVMTRQDLTPELAADIAECDRLVLIDASVDGPVGTVVRRRILPIATFGAMSHSVQPDALLTIVRQLYDRTPDAFLLTLRGLTFELSDCRLSEPVSIQVPEIVEAALTIAAYGQDHIRETPI